MAEDDYHSLVAVFVRISGFNRSQLGWHVLVAVVGLTLIIWGIYAGLFIAHFWFSWLVPIACGVYTLGNQVRYWRKWQNYD